MFWGLGSLLSIAAIQSAKAQMSHKREADEKELLMMTMFTIGFTIPMIQFCMSAGPMIFRLKLRSLIAMQF
jgi:hypothetical protein